MNKPKSTRVTTAVVSIMPSFEATVNQIAQLQVELGTKTAARAAEVEKVLERYNSDIKPLEKEVERLSTMASAYAQTHWEELSKDPKIKSSETELATYGFRTGNPTVKPIAKVKEADLAQQLHDQGYDAFVCATYTLNKDALLQAVRDKNPVACQLFKIVQTERFWVEAKAQQG